MGDGDNSKDVDNSKDAAKSKDADKSKDGEKPKDEDAHDGKITREKRDGEKSRWGTWEPEKKSEVVEMDVEFGEPESWDNWAQLTAENMRTPEKEDKTDAAPKKGPMTPAGTPVKSPSSTPLKSSK